MRNLQESQESAAERLLELVEKSIPLSKPPRSAQDASGKSSRRQLPHWIRLDQPGRLRVANVQALLNVSRATLYAGLASGRYPKPDGHDGNMPYWCTETIRPLLEPKSASKS
jgi:hypothetical protein